ncbi:MAG: hypothetical protein AAGG72_03765, partial [Pseudomonadota bacterium]
VDFEVVAVDFSAAAGLAAGFFAAVDFAAGAVLLVFCLVVLTDAAFRVFAAVAEAGWVSVAVRDFVF